MIYIFYNILLSINYLLLLSIIYYLLSIIYYLLSITYYLLPITYYLLFCYVIIQLLSLSSIITYTGRLIIGMIGFILIGRTNLRGA